MIASPCPAPKRGALRDRHGRWQRDAVDAMARETSEARADGEGVWSWHPKAGAKLATMLAHRADDGDNKVWFTGESAQDTVNTIAQGRPVVTDCTCGQRARANVLCAGAPGACGHPVFPAPSEFSRVLSLKNSGASRRGKADVCLSLRAKRGNPESHRGGILDRFVAYAPRNDSAVRAGRGDRFRRPKFQALRVRRQCQSTI